MYDLFQPSQVIPYVWNPQDEVLGVKTFPYARLQFKIPFFWLQKPPKEIFPLKYSFSPQVICDALLRQSIAFAWFASRSH